MKILKTFLLLTCIILCNYTYCNHALGSDSSGKPGNNFKISQKATEFLKKSIKRYKIYKYKKDEILCEPYKVSKNDWLYKIFRKKGEISERDFPLFIDIFKAFNPGISDIDAIHPGQEILIPLKKIHKNDFKEISPGVIDVPMIEFTSIPKELKPFIIKHKVKKGESLYRILDPVFLEKNGKINPKAIQILKLCNPGIKDLNTIYAGSFINIPSADLYYQPWFKKTSFPFRKPEITKINPQKKKTYKKDKNKIKTDKKGKTTNNIANNIKNKTNNKLTFKQALKRYASVVGGELVQDGNFYFPRKNRPDIVLNLKSYPVIELPNGGKILIAHKRKKNNMKLFREIRHFWKNLKIITPDAIINNQIISHAEDKTKIMKSVSKYQKHVPVEKSIIRYSAKDNLEKTIILPHDYEKALEKILSFTKFHYIPNSKLSLLFHGIRININIGKIQLGKSANKKSILIDFGNIYGYALDIIKKRGMDIIVISPKEKFISSMFRVFTTLGASVTKNPVFVSNITKKPITIHGLYITGSSDIMRENGFCITYRKPDEIITSFLNRKNIKLLLYMESGRFRG